MPRIMVVDDDDDVRAYLAKVLLEAGYEVASAADAHTALLRMRQNPPDLLLTDIVMPHTDGWALMRACRAEALLTGVPVLMMSASANMRDLADLAGAQGFLLKPLSPTAIVGAVVDTLAQTGRTTTTNDYGA